MTTEITDAAIPPWCWTWGLGIGVVVAAKAVLAARAPTASAAWVFGWPGMDPERFHRPPPDRPRQAEIGWALGHTGIGACLLALAVTGRAPDSIGPWVGLLGCGLVLHFGLVRLLSAFWRHRGYDAQPLFDAPLRARSIGEFWGRRWNRAFSDIATRWIYTPLRRQLGPRRAGLAVFAASGVGHDLLLSVPAGGGYGCCTAYFAIQAAGVMFERRRPRRRWRTLCWVILPLPLLFHPTFLDRVWRPFLAALGGVG